MSLPLLFTMPKDQDSWRGWVFNHAVLHYDLVNTLQTQMNVTGLDQFQLDPIDMNNLGIWLYWHQTMHNQANAALKTSGYDLLALNWQDPDQFQQWLFMNGDEHRRFAQAVGSE